MSRNKEAKWRKGLFLLTILFCMVFNLNLISAKNEVYTVIDEDDLSITLEIDETGSDAYEATYRVFNRSPYPLENIRIDSQLLDDKDVHVHHDLITIERLEPGAGAKFPVELLPEDYASQDNDAEKTEATATPKDDSISKTGEDSDAGSLIFIGLLLILAISLLIYYKKNHKHSNTKYLSLLLALFMVLSPLASVKALTFSFKSETKITIFGKEFKLLATLAYEIKVEDSNDTDDTDASLPTEPEATTPTIPEPTTTKPQPTETEPEETLPSQSQTTETTTEASETTPSETEPEPTEPDQTTPEETEPTEPSDPEDPIEIWPIKFTDDGRAHKGISSFKASIAKENEAVILVRRYESENSPNQKAEISVDGEHVADWEGVPAIEGKWVQEKVTLPAEVTKEKDSIEIANKFISAGNDFSEFRYFIFSVVKGELILTDEVDVGGETAESIASEEAHDYKITEDKWSGSRERYLPEDEAFYDVMVTDDGRAHKGTSSFTAKIKAENKGVILTRRYESEYSAHQKARILVDGQHVADWEGKPAVKKYWVEERVLLPAAATAGKESIEIANAFVSAGNDFSEFRYFVDSIVDGELIRTDELDIGGKTPVSIASEDAHNYTSTDPERWAGIRTRLLPKPDYSVIDSEAPTEPTDPTDPTEPTEPSEPTEPTEEPKPGDRFEDDGRAHKGNSSFDVTIDPENEGVVLMRRYASAHSPNQKAKVFVDDVYVADWFGAPVNPEYWIHEEIDLPAKETKGKDSIRIKNQFVSAGNDFNEFRYFVYSIVDGQRILTDEVNIGGKNPDSIASEKAHNYEIDGEKWSGNNTFKIPDEVFRGEEEEGSNDSEGISHDDMSYEDLAEMSQKALYDEYWDDTRKYFRREYPNTLTDLGNDYWWFAHAIDTLIDGYERSGNTIYLDRAKAAVSGVQKRLGKTLVNDYYDDMEWMALALVRLYDHTKDETYLNLAKDLFAEIEGGWTDVAGGGISWSKKKTQFKNTPANAPAVILAVKLHERTGEKAYADMAQKIFDWLNDTLRDNLSGFVADGINDNNDMQLSWGAFTYNNGTYIGAATEMFRMTGEPKYLEYAEKTFQNSVSQYSGDNGVVKEEGQDDGGLFKGIMMRYVKDYYFAQNDDRPDIREWFEGNAKSVASHAINEANLISDKWNGPAKAKNLHLSSHLSGTMLFEFTHQVSTLEHKEHRYLPYVDDYTYPDPVEIEDGEDTENPDPTDPTDPDPEEPEPTPEPTPEPMPPVEGPVEPPKEVPVHGWDIYRRLDLLPEIDNGSQTLQFSSFDREGGNWSDGFDGKYSYLRKTDQGYVIAEASGAGEIQSMWFTRDEGDVSATGNLIVELDGKVVLNQSLQSLVNGEMGAPFVYPFVANAEESSGGVIIKVPIPYKESMRITTTNNPLFYHVTYRKFASNEDVETFDPSYVPTDVMEAAKTWGYEDPKPEVEGAQVVEDDFSLPEGESITLYEGTGSGYINEITVNIPQFEPAPPTVTVTDDGRAHKGTSSFKVSIDPANEGVVLTRRYDSFSTNQKAKISVDGKHVADWIGKGATPGVWLEEAVFLPAEATAGKSTISISNAFVSAGIDFSEFHYFVDSIVDGEAKRTDAVDVGNGPESLASEKEHGYKVTKASWAGTRTYDMPTEATKPMPRVQDDGRAHKGTSAFDAKIDPNNTGIRLIRRYDSISTNQKGLIRVDGELAAKWSGYIATPGFWIEEVVYIPGEFTRGRDSVRIENQFVSAGMDFSEFRYFVDSIVDGEIVRTDEIDVANNESEKAHNYTLDKPLWIGERSNLLPDSTLGELDNIQITDLLLEKVRVKVTIDGRVRVNAPMGEFFGSALGEAEVRALMFKMDPEGDYSSWWPMPYAKSAKVKLVNDSEFSIGPSHYKVVQATDETVADRLTRAYPELAYFEAVSKNSQARLGQDWQAFHVGGHGKFVGIVHALHGNVASGNSRGYLEGDERFYTDGMRSPGWHGTGTEDFYEGGWYFNNGVFTNPMNGQVSYRSSNKYAPYVESDAVYRLLIGDAVSYNRSLEAGFEPGGFSEHNVVYSATSFFYAHFNNRTLILNDRVDVGDTDSEKAHNYEGSGDVVELSSQFEGNYSAETVRDTLRKSADKVSFTVKINPQNHGVRIVRMSDQSVGYQSAEVYVNGELVGNWLQPLENVRFKWLEDSYDIPRELTNGQETLNIEIVPTEKGPKWSAARYDVYVKLPEAATSGDSLDPIEPGSGEEKEIMKVLSIGNSFSTDAQRWLNELSKAYGQEIESYNLFIGGAPLDKHVENFKNEKHDYLLERNGYAYKTKASIQDALAITHYDVITVQQVSGLSGLLDTYQPYIGDLIAMVKEVQPDAEIVFHQTWAYDDDSDHWDFPRYGKDRQTMYEGIQNASKSIAADLDLRIIPVGEVVHRLRESDYFATKGAHQISYSPYDKEMTFPDWTNDPANPPSMTRDGYHLNEYYGRYAAAATWYAVLTGEKLSGNDWKPTEPVQYPQNQHLPDEVWDFIRATVDEVVEEFR